MLDAVVAKLAKLDRDPGAAQSGPQAAVAAILRSPPEAAASSVELLFIRRAEHANDPWSGHVAFPGGRRDPDDESLLMAAIRETREEVGIVLAPEDCLGRLPDVPAFSRSRKGNLVVTPFVFALRNDAEIVPNTVEVAMTLWVPLEPLVAGTGREDFAMSYDGKDYVLPSVFLPFDSEVRPHRLWGMTLRMVDTLVEVLR